MKQVLYILFGWSVTLAVSVCFGKLVLHKLSVRLYRQEENVFAFLVGSACLSLSVFLLAAMHLAYKGIFLGLSILVIGITARSGASHQRSESLPRMPLFWKLVFLSVWLVFGAIYFAYALAPESSPDGTTYHLGLVAHYAREHALPPITTNLYASLPQGLEMLFLFAFVWGRHSAAALVHFTYLLLLPWLILNWGRRLAMPSVGVAGGLIIFLAPIAGICGTSAYNDVALAAVVFAVFALLEIWNEQQEATVLVAAGALAGFAFLIKYTGFIAAAYAVARVTHGSWRSHRSVLRPILLIAVPAAVFITPTLVKNLIVVHNPVSPFFNQVFKNPNVHVEFEQSWTRDLRSYGVQSLQEWSFDVTTRGVKTGGVLGPVFLLAPLSLVALRRAPGRRLCLATLFFLLTYPFNLSSRFLLPAAVFVAPGIAMALNSNVPLALLVAAHAYLSWPAHVPRYATAWRLRGQPLRPALRLEPEDDYLSRRLGADYAMVRLIERVTPPDSRIFAFDVPPYAYCSREFLPAYYSATSVRLRDVLQAGFDGSLQPLQTLQFRMSPRRLRGVRLVETATTRPMTPGITEVRIFGPSGELAMDPAWRLKAHPYPWDVALAFDRNPVTRWKAWQQVQKGAWVEVDFGHEETVSSVRLEITQDQYFVQWALQGETASGEWTVLNATSEPGVVPGPLDLRREAMRELKRNNIRYLLVNSPYVENEFQAHAQLWGIDLIAAFPGQQLYHLLE